MDGKASEDASLRRARLLAILAAERIAGTRGLSAIEFWNAMVLRVPNLLVPAVARERDGAIVLTWERYGCRVTVRLQEKAEFEYHVAQGAMSSAGWATLEDTVDFLVEPLAGISRNRLRTVAVGSPPG